MMIMTMMTMLTTTVTTTDTQKECCNFEGTDTDLQISIGVVSEPPLQEDHTGKVMTLRPSAVCGAAVSQHLSLIMMLLCNMLTLWTITSTKLKWTAIQSLLPPLSLLYLHDLATFVKLLKNSGIHFCSAKCYHPSQKDSEGVGHIHQWLSKASQCSSCRGYTCLAFNITLATTPSLQGASLY